MNLTDCRAVLLTGTGVGPGWSTCGFNRLDWWEVTKRTGGVARAQTSGALIPSGDHLKVSRAAARILNTHWPLGPARIASGHVLPTINCCGGAHKGFSSAVGGFSQFLLAED